MSLFSRRALVNSLILLALLLAAGCSHVPLLSMVQFARIDFATTDPASLRAAVKLPQVAQTRRDRVHMRIAVKVDGMEDGADFLLQEVSDPADVLVLAKELEPGTVIVAYQVAPADLPRLLKFRDAILKRKREPGGTLSISIQPEVCRTGELPRGPVLFSTYLKTSETGGYVPLTRDLDLRTIAAKRDVAAAIPPCD